MTRGAAGADVPVVELRAARIPFIGVIAHHHWFVVTHPGGPEPDRWEVWQRPDSGGCLRAGHLHRNLLPAEAGVGSGPSWIIATWRDEAAVALAERIERSAVDYPWRFRYRYWPGPNSNTYVQWILGDDFLLGRCGVGRSYCRARRWHSGCFGVRRRGSRDRQWRDDGGWW